MSRRRLRDEIDAEEFQDWMLFDQDNQFEERADFRAAQLCCLMSHSKVRPLDFMPYSVHEKTEEELQDEYETKLDNAVTVFKAYSVVHNASVNRLNGNG